MVIKEAATTDLAGLLDLYTHLHNNQLPEITEEINLKWKQVIDNDDHHIIIGIENDSIVSSCVLVVVPNFTHNQQPYAIIENVITHPEHRNKGYASRILDFAKQVALGANCYKIMLMTGSKEESTLRLYKRAGYNNKDKTAFIQWL